MGIVFKPEPLPPEWDRMSLDEKRAWYHRVRANAVAAMNRQRDTFPFLPGPPPPPDTGGIVDRGVVVGGTAHGIVIALIAAALAIAAIITHPH